MSNENPIWSPEKFLTGNVRKTSLTEGNVLLSGIWHRPLRPQMVWSRTKRGALPSEWAMPNLPKATPSGNCRCASCNVPSNSKTQPLSISCWTRLRVSAISSSALCQLEWWAESGGSSTSVLSLIGKQLPGGMSCWKPVPTPAMSDGKRDWSGSRINWLRQRKISKHIGWWGRTCQSGEKPESHKNCSKSCLKGASTSSEKGGWAWSSWEKYCNKHLSNRRSTIRRIHCFRKGPKISGAKRSPRLQSGLEGRPPPSSCPNGGYNGSSG